MYKYPLNLLNYVFDKYVRISLITNKILKSMVMLGLSCNIILEFCDTLQLT